MDHVDGVAVLDLVLGRGGGWPPGVIDRGIGAAGAVPAMGWDRTRSPGTPRRATRGWRPGSRRCEQHAGRIAAAQLGRARPGAVGRSASTTISRASTTLRASPGRSSSRAATSDAHQSSGDRGLETANRVGRAGPPSRSRGRGAGEAASGGPTVVIQRLPSSARPTRTSGTTRAQAGEDRRGAHRSRRVPTRPAEGVVHLDRVQGGVHGGRRLGRVARRDGDAEGLALTGQPLGRGSRALRAHRPRRAGRGRGRAARCGPAGPLRSRLGRRPRVERSPSPAPARGPITGRGQQLGDAAGQGLRRASAKPARGAGRPAAAAPGR